MARIWLKQESYAGSCARSRRRSTRAPREASAASERYGRIVGVQPADELMLPPEARPGGTACGAEGTTESSVAGDKCATVLRDCAWDNAKFFGGVR
jgi:hypothetical protein